MTVKMAGSIHDRFHIGFTETALGRDVLVKLGDEHIYLTAENAWDAARLLETMANVIDLGIVVPPQSPKTGKATAGGKE